MFQKNLLTCLFLCATSVVIAQKTETASRNDSTKVVKFSESALVITSSRVNDRMPIAVNNLNKKDIERLNYGQVS